MDASTPAVIDRVVDGRYRVEAEIARGGMATVYRARDLRLDRPVALKVMRPDLAHDQAFVRRFQQEARAAARLSHPHIVSVYDQGEDGDLVFLAMQLVDGPTLRDVIEHRSPASARQALTLLIPVAEALAEAHRRGLVHRDVKPENVLIDQGRHNGVKVVDFGLARAISAASHHTSEMLWGTAAYLAPEQVERGRADPRTDVYGVGLLLFELLSGRKAFPGDDPLQVAYDHVHRGLPDLRALVPTVPPAVASLVVSAAATDPGDRPQDAGELLDRMRELLRELPDPALDAVPARPGLDGEDGQKPDDADATRALGVSDGPQGDPTQLLPGGGHSQTRQLPVAGRATSDGHYARTTGNTVRTPRRRPAPPVQAPPPPPRRRGGAGRWLLALLLVALLAGGGYGFWWLTEGPGVHSAMPAVVELSEEDARSALDARQLDAVVTYAYSEDVPDGTVISADREPGTNLRHGTDVTLVVSQGQERYAVPPLTGLTLESAQAALESANLALGEQSREHDEVEPEGRVLRSDPESGELLPPDGEVDLVISSGPAPVEVPDVTGRPQQEATDALTRAGLTVTVDPQRTHDEDVPEGAVLSQSPSSGTLARGETVTLVISDGPELVTVPQVVGSQFGTVEDELTELGLVVVREDIRGGFFGSVRSQSIEPGEEVPVGTEILLEVV
ncbi:Stk1 family PASTA domain-containing Ser/Thr kinase [Ornithinimicrobium sufpigmenti]|uniref:Stk1 family PASTA domain-containing Ser/Thr kinase n=1 Tax=Ornithinimicrobium sufpigmenti TaxID=2508882 RepID=UPI0015E1691B|nr:MULTISPECIES: Stk1 family PASTA domain-containing Ser/Thr kinase [unclassified Ornithinimicrobium]